MRIIYFITICCFTIACNNASSTSENAAPKKSLADSLLQQVLDGHDVAMPKMMKLERLQKQAQTEIDSLKKTNTKANAARITLLDNTNKKLQDANAIMHQWMDGFKYDSLKENEPARIDYLKTQIESVNKMKDAVLSSIAAADSVFAK